MKNKISWLFPVSIEEAKQAQREMAKEVILQDRQHLFYSIGGMDVSNNLYDPTQMIYGATVVLSSQHLECIEESTTSQKQTFPYIPGLLAFREAPALIETFYKLEKKPDLLMIDGHGISHPEGLGIASHIGVLLDIATIGVAKSILIGQLAGPLGSTVGDETPLIWREKQIGTVLRTKTRANPLIISPGHKISLPTAVAVVKASFRGYRLPEPTRQAHLAANRCRKIGRS